MATQTEASVELAIATDYDINELCKVRQTVFPDVLDD